MIGIALRKIAATGAKQFICFSNILNHLLEREIDRLLEFNQHVRREESRKHWDHYWKMYGTLTPSSLQSHVHKKGLRYVYIASVPLLCLLVLTRSQILPCFNALICFKLRYHVSEKCLFWPRSNLADTQAAD